MGKKSDVSPHKIDQIKVLLSKVALKQRNLQEKTISFNTNKLWCIIDCKKG